MKAYIFAIVKNMTNPQHYLSKYAPKSLASIEKHGGKFLYRNGARELIEGAPIDDRIVLVEFPSHEAAKTWYNSKEYQEAKSEREGIAEASIYILDSFHQK
jgi:uncharacterized protein (DUF1330 family)